MFCTAVSRHPHLFILSQYFSRENSLPQVSTHFTITTTHGHTFLNLEFWGWILDGRKLPSRIDLDGQIGPGHKCLLLPPGHQKIWKDIYITIRQFSTSKTKRPTSVLYGLEQAFFNTFMVAGVLGLLSFEARKLEFFHQMLEFYSQGPWAFSKTRKFWRFRVSFLKKWLFLVENWVKMHQIWHFFGALRANRGTFFAHLQHKCWK